MPGIESDVFKKAFVGSNLSSTTLGHALGNSICVPVLERLLPCLFQAAKLVRQPGPDRWLLCAGLVRDTMEIDEDQNKGEGKDSFKVSFDLCMARVRSLN